MAPEVENHVNRALPNIEYRLKFTLSSRFLVPSQQAFLGRISIETRNDI